MSDQRPEPTTDDRWPAGARVGRLDLSSHLGADTGERPLPAGFGSVALRDERPDRATEDDGAGATARTADDTGPARGRADLGERSGGRRLPLILPPAKVDEELAAEAAHLRRRALDARDDSPAPEETLAEPAPRRSRFRRRTASVSRPLPPPALSPQTPAAPASLASLAGPVEDAAVGPEAPAVPGAPESSTGTAPEDLTSETSDSTQAEELAAALRAHPEAAEAFRVQAGESVGPGVLDDLDDDPDDWVPPRAEPAADVRPDRLALDLDQEVAEVAEVAASVIAAMRALGEANEAHLEAVEAEVARRHELLTAQAELDAELIRLHARREAHAIIAAARLRTGGRTTTTTTDQLGEIGETFSRFAESVETMIGLGPTSDPGRSHP